jgi:hypothetical protein
LDSYKLSKLGNIATKQKKMRMKKIFALGLIFVLFALIQSWVPAKTTPVDQDVGICYVAPMDQVADELSNIADNNTIYLPDSRSSPLSVEKDSYIITPSSFSFDVLCLYESHYGTPANKMTNQKPSNNVIRGHRLDIGELFSQNRVMSRHT